MEYIEDQIREKILREIEYLDLPIEWTPKDTISYIVSKLSKGNNGK
jgi:hypothetical protein